MKKQVIAPAALVALREALSTIYWYKNDLRSFLASTITEPRILVRLDWSSFKRDIVAMVVDAMAQDQSAYGEELLHLMLEVARVEDFSHLERLEDGVSKAKQARNAVAALKTFIAPHKDLIVEQERAERRRDNARQEAARFTAVQEKLKELSGKYYRLLSSSDPSGRGYIFERVIKDLFALFDLDPKAAFRIVGEQIDGAFTFDGTDYLFEGRWQKERVSAKDLDSFAAKVSRKLDNTLGLFVSVNGFSEDGIAAHSGGRRTVILMDGSHLMAVLEARIRLTDLLLRLRRHASQTGEILLPIGDILGATNGPDGVHRSRC